MFDLEVREGFLGARAKKRNTPQGQYRQQEKHSAREAKQRSSPAPSRLIPRGVEGSVGEISLQLSWRRTSRGGFESRPRVPKKPMSMVTVQTMTIARKVGSAAK